MYFYIDLENLSLLLLKSFNTVLLLSFIWNAKTKFSKIKRQLSAVFSSLNNLPSPFWYSFLLLSVSTLTNFSPCLLSWSESWYLRFYSFLSRLHSNLIFHYFELIMPFCLSDFNFFMSSVMILWLFNFYLDFCHGGKYSWFLLQTGSGKEF